MITLILECERLPIVLVEMLGESIPCKLNRDKHNNISIEIDVDLAVLTKIKLIIVDMNENKSIGLVEIIAEGIRFGLVTFLCTTVDNTQNTQLTAPGTIDIMMGTPSWKFWCDKMNQFNYKDYPLGSLA